MAELYQMGDRARDRTKAPRESDKAAAVLPIRAVILLCAIAAIGTWQLGGLVASPEKPLDYEPVTASFHACAENERRACTIDAGSFFLDYGRIVVIGDARAPNAQTPACPAEAEAARTGAARLARLLNGGAFEMRHDIQPIDAMGRQLRILSRDGVSLGDLLARQGVVTAPGERPRWCDQSTTRTTPTG